MDRSDKVLLPARRSLAGHHPRELIAPLAEHRRLLAHAHRAHFPFPARSYRVMAAAGDSLYSGFSAKDIDGNVCDLGSFAGKVALVVNLASI